MFRKILELLYPTTCIFCGGISKEGICGVCREKVGHIQEPRCKRCGKPIHLEEEEFCYDCKHRDFHYEQGKSLWLHRAPVDRSIYDFKYKNRRSYGEIYAKEMVEAFGEIIRLWEIDLLIPVPLHKKKLRKRGFNQAEVIAEGIGKRMNIPIDTTLVVRRKYTMPQKEFSQKERRRNLADAFRVSHGNIGAKNILIIDDIYTTGSTVDSIAKVLKDAGAEKTYFLTISIGQGF